MNRLFRWLLPAPARTPALVDALRQALRDYRTDRQRQADADRLECALIWSATQANEETTDD
jgi:hypothetical protein